MPQRYGVSMPEDWSMRERSNEVDMKGSQSNGHVFQINASQGGVPKLALSYAEVNAEGLVGDQQANMEVHGGPERALCLYSLERILLLQDEGHPIYPGAIGENLTITGLDWQAITPGIRLQLGENVEIEITRYTTPCNTIAEAFSDRKSSRVSQALHPGWSRVYARVLKGGVIRVGDKVAISRA